MRESMPPDTRPLRTALIGYGLAGRVFHSPFLEASPNFSLDFITTSDSARREQAHRQHPFARILANAQELAGYFDSLDLVVLASPPSAHLEQGLAAMDAGVAIVVDKPFAASDGDALALIQRAEANDLPLIVFHNRRWDGDFLTVRDVIERGKLGDIYQFESSFEHWAPEASSRWQDRTPIEAGGGVTFDLGSHLIDQALVLFGPVRDVQADVRTIRAGGGNDDVSFIKLIHQSGTRSHLFMSRLGAQPGPRFRVLGTHGAFVSYGLDGQEPSLEAGVKPDDGAYGIEPESTWGSLVTSNSGEPRSVKVPTVRGDYPGFYEQIARAVRGKGPLPIEPRDALEVVKIIMQVHAQR